MKHVLIGGDGFVGRFLARQLLARGAEVAIYDVRRSDLEIYQRAAFHRFDITDPNDIDRLQVGPEDVVYNLAARMLDPILPHWKRRDFFWPVNARGVGYLLERMRERGCRRLVHFSTDMVYGHALQAPVGESHPCVPLGHYGGSKRESEDLCAAYRARGMNITIFRPRLIIGPGRLGILRKLFWLVDRNLPVPLIGGGANHYQFISVFDCANAAVCAFDRGVPSSTYNLGSKDPPTVAELLRTLIEEARSRSVLVRTPAGLVKRALDTLEFLGLPVMDPEQYLIADEDCVLDVARAEAELGWQPRFRDDDMLVQAYREYRQAMLEAAPA